MKIWSFYLRETEPEVLGDSPEEQIDCAIPRKAYRTLEEALRKAKEELEQIGEGDEEWTEIDLDWQETDEGGFWVDDPRSCLRAEVFPLEID